MTLEDLKKLFGEAIDKAHFIVAGLSKNEKVEGVSLHLDSDGVMSIVFHVEHTQGRTETDESTHLKNAMEVYDYFGMMTVKELEGAFIDWETLNDALDGYAWPDNTDDLDDIPDRIKTLLKDRNALAKEIETLKKKLQPPKPKEEPKKNSKVKKIETKLETLEPAEIEATRSKVFDHVSHSQPISATRIAEDLVIPYDRVERVLNHEWFEKRKAGWRIAIKGKKRQTGPTKVTLPKGD